MAEINNEGMVRTAGNTRPSAPPYPDELTPSGPPQRASKKSSNKKLIPALFFTVVIVMVIITFILGIVQSSRGHAGKLPILLGISMLANLFIQFVYGYLARSGSIKARNTWYIYLIGVCIVLQCIFTDIVIFN